MVPRNLLRDQVFSELKKRRLIFFTMIFLGFLYLSISFIFGDLSLIRYIEISKKKSHLEKEIIEMQKENEQLKIEITLINEDPYYIEKYAREEFGLVKKGEWVFFHNEK